MNKKQVSIILCIVVIALSASGCGIKNSEEITAPYRDAQIDATELKIVTSTTQLSILIEQIGGKTVTVTNIIPPDGDPLNYTFTEKDLVALSGADAFFFFD